MNINKHKELLVVKYGNLFILFLTIDFEKKEDYYVIESKKFNLKIETTNLNLADGKKEFNEIFDLLIHNYINEGILFKIFNYLGIEKQPVSKVIADNKKEFEEFKEKQKVHLVKYDADQFMRTVPINIDKMEASLDWRSM